MTSAAMPVAPMLARLVRALPDGDYIFEPKWDGFRCLAVHDGRTVELWSRHGRPLGRYFPELLAAVGELGSDPFMLDGEVLVTVEGRLDFAALMGRLHPAASRVQELTQRTPGLFVAFDVLREAGEDLLDRPFGERRERLVALLRDGGSPVHLTPATEDRQVAERWLAEFCGGGLDGVVAKARDLPYCPGVRAMLKVKHERTAECVVAGLRAAGHPPEVTALMLGLYDTDDELAHIGVASGLARTIRHRLAVELAPLAVDLPGHPWEQGFLLGGGALGRLKGAAGRWRPGMTLDWVPIAPTRVAEVTYTQVDAHRLRHPAKLLRWRPDREPRSCRLTQLDVPPLPPAAQVLGA